MIVTTMTDIVGQVISEEPYVRILSRPRYQEYELVPGWVVGRWEAVAQVEGMLATVELSVRVEDSSTFNKNSMKKRK